jgi:hypothetical protein
MKENLERLKEIGILKAYLKRQDAPRNTIEALEA